MHCFGAGFRGKLQSMNASISILIGCAVTLLALTNAPAEPTPAALAGFNARVVEVETRLNEQHRSRASLLPTRDFEARLRKGDLIVEQIPEPELPGALLHHWRGTAFAPGVTATDFERLLRDFKVYPKRFAPDVLGAKVISEQGDRMQAWMRVRQKHVLTVVMDSTYDVEFGRLDAANGFSASRSTQIYEIAGAGTAQERALGATEEHGFLWRLNSYWTYEERDGGLYVQIESVSLSRSIPAGLGWAVKPFVESVPRESLEFTLRSAVNAVRR